LGPHGLFPFSAISPVDGNIVESGLDRWLPCNDRILSCINSVELSGKSLCFVLLITFTFSHIC
jgi:hypothetical protein